MFCPMCGAPNEDDAIFCGNCGAALNPDEVSVEPVGEATVEIGAGAETSGEAAEEAELVFEPSPPEPSFVDDWAVEPSPPPAAPPPPPPPPPAASAPSTPTNGLAIASLVLGIGGLTVLPLLGSILAIIFGYMARRDIRARPSETTGDGLAVAGIVMGWIAVGLSVVGLLFFGGLAICGVCGALGAGSYSY